MSEIAKVSKTYRGRRNFWYVFQPSCQSEITELHQ